MHRQTDGQKGRHRQHQTYKHTHVPSSLTNSVFQGTDAYGQSSANRPLVMVTQGRRLQVQDLAVWGGGMPGATNAGSCSPHVHNKSCLLCSLETLLLHALNTG
jgi:hypothetical protein